MTRSCFFFLGGEKLTKNLSDESARAINRHQEIVDEMRELERLGLTNSPGRRARHRQLSKELREIRASEVYRNGLPGKV